MTPSKKQFMKSRDYLALVAQLPCCIRGTEPVELHHIKNAGLTGTSQKCSDFFVIPLHPSLHREFHAVGRRTWEMRYGAQADHLAATYYRLLKLHDLI